MDDDGLQKIRGNGISMIFQDPLSALHPFYKVGKQLVEAIQIHQDVGDAAARAHAVDLLQPRRHPRRRARGCGEYPHEFSGGMRQRVMIAMALTNDPKLLIADEPTTALDVTTQAQILRADRATSRPELGMAVIMITHDLGVIAEVADRVMVMYAGEVVESGTLDQIFYDPQHPYTWGLLGSLTRVDQPRTRSTRPDRRPAAVADQPAAGLPLPQSLPARVRRSAPSSPALKQRVRRPPRTRPLLVARPGAEEDAAGRLDRRDRTGGAGGMSDE